MRYCMRCGWWAKRSKEKSRLCPDCRRPTSVMVFNRILDAENNILYEGLDKDQAEVLWTLAKHNHRLVKRIEYAY